MSGNDMKSRTGWVVTDIGDSLVPGMTSDLVMAWGRDRETKEPRYIGELGKDRRGEKCGCECYSCGAPLTAVNAARSTFIKRPHFRHPDGARRDDCLVLTARAAALETLKPDGWLQLPARRRSARLMGLSGQYHEAWVEAPRQRVRIKDVEFRDQVTGIVTLDDGRQLQVSLVGSLDASDEDAVIPTIMVVVNDPELAAMSPEELRQRLVLIVEQGTWCSHWADADLAAQALAEATATAIDALDWLGEGVSLPVEMGAEAKRETLLHMKAKEILEREGQICVPGLKVEVETVLPSGAVLRKTNTKPSRVLLLESVILEKNVGQIRPDVVAITKAQDDWPAERLLVEVTVTNAIDDERRARIADEGFAALEIDIARMGGVVTEDEFGSLVVFEEAGKRWLHHPWLEAEHARLVALLKLDVDRELAKLEALRKEQEQWAARKAIPVMVWADQYLDAVARYGDLRALVEADLGDRVSMAEALERVRECAEGLAVHRYPEAKDETLFLRQGNILDRLLSIKLDRAVGYRISTAWQVINAILSERGYGLMWHTLYLLASRLYVPKLTSDQWTTIQEWRQRVADSLGAGEGTYRRDRRYDRLLSLLFPEMAKCLAMELPGDRSKYHSYTTQQELHYENTWDDSTQATPILSQSSESYAWLSGAAFDKWAAQNPQSAEAWKKRGKY